MNRPPVACASSDERVVRPAPLRVATVADDADRAALERIARDELGALDELYERYKTMVGLDRLPDHRRRHLAEDVVQEAFLGVWRNATRYVEGRGSVKTWLLSIVHHRAIDAVRHGAPRSICRNGTMRRRRRCVCPTSGGGRVEPGCRRVRAALASHRRPA